MASEIAIFAGKQLATTIAKKFGTSVIERWTRYRAQQFFEGFTEAFAREVSTGTESSAVDQVLEQILGDDKKTEVLYDAYRSVCFSKSKTIGPRILGLLTASIVLENRAATDEEEPVFKAAEALSDPELLEFFKAYRKYSAESQDKKSGKDEPYRKGGSIVVPWSEEHSDSAWPNDEIDISPFDLNEALGSWAAQLEIIGLISTKMTQSERPYKEDGERHIDQDGVVTTYSYSIVLDSPCALLARLYERALGAADAAQ